MSKGIKLPSNSFWHSPGMVRNLKYVCGGDNGVAFDSDPNDLSPKAHATLAMWQQFAADSPKVRAAIPALLAGDYTVDGDTVCISGETIKEEDV